MSTVFLDTVGLIALWDEADQWHAPASQAMRAVNVPGTRFVTTAQVILECGNAATRRPYRADVCSLRERMVRHGELIEPPASEIEHAWAAYRREGAEGASIVDHISIVIMRRLGIADAFTNDRHFAAAGFNTLF
jgi:predicted nucleic acid-binding protein